jgi:ribosomal protein S16
LRIAHDRVAYWQQNGAKLSDTVQMLVARAAKGTPEATAGTAAASAPAG